MLLFSVAVGCAGLDPPGVHIRTLADVTAEVEAFRRLAKSLNENADECLRLGQNLFARLLCAKAKSLSEQAERRQSVVKVQAGTGREVPNPWIVERESKVDRRLRGFIIELVITCRILFDKDLLGIVATIASVAFDQKVTSWTVRGIARGIDDPCT
jgi:hypothetical protein